MIKSNTIIAPTQSPPGVVVVSSVGEKISDVNGDVMTQQLWAVWTERELKRETGAEPEKL